MGEIILRYSPSALGLYQSCPKAYELKYISNAPTITSFTPIPLLKGSIVHKILELSATKPENVVLTEVVSQFGDYDLVKELMEELKKTTLEDGFYNNLFSTETRLYFNYDEIEFLGIIDRINKFGEKDYEIIDYKYGNNEQSNMNNLQPQLYAWAMFSNYGYDINLRFSYYNIKHRTKYTKKFIPKDIDIEAIVALARRSQINFEPKTGFGCVWCSFLQFCNEGKEFVHGEIELKSEDISEVFSKLLQIKERQSLYNFKRKKYEEIAKMYFEYSGNTEIKIDSKVIRYDPENKKLVI